MKTKSITLGLRGSKYLILFIIELLQDPICCFCLSEIWNILKKYLLLCCLFAFLFFHVPVRSVAEVLSWHTGAQLTSWYTQLGGHSLWLIVFWNFPVEVHVLILGFCRCFTRRPHVFSMWGTGRVHKFRAASLLAGMRGLLFNFISSYCSHRTCLLSYALFLFCLFFKKSLHSNFLSNLILISILWPLKWKMLQIQNKER